MVDCSVYVVDCTVAYMVECSVAYMIVLNCTIDCSIDQCMVSCTYYDFSSMTMKYDKVSTILTLAYARFYFV